jgi:hypothetical protein
VLIAEVVTILARSSTTISPADSRQRSRETPATIVEAEARLVAVHGLFTLSHLLVLLGLPGLFGPRRPGWGGSDWSGSWLRSPARC